jgi:sugar (glycoside-pentoside-hexuronide) transporter
MSSVSAAIETGDPQRPHISIAKRIGFAAGDFGNNFSWSLIGSYLMFFMTDVAMIPAAMVGTVMLVSKAWDAINDPIVGALADNTKTRWGRYRPWILFSCVPMLFFNVMCFTTSASWSQGFRTVWAFGAYFILVLLYTMVNIPYSAMPATLTLSAVDRSKLASTRMAGAYLAMTTLSFLTLRLVNWVGAGNPQKGYQTTAIIFSCIALPCYIFCFASQKEVVNVAYRKTSYGKLFKVLKGNTPTMLCLIAFVAWGVRAGGSAARMYYFRYVAGNTLIFANNATISSIASIMGTLSLTFLVGKVKNKGTLAAWAFIIDAALMAAMFWVPITRSGGVIVYYVLNAFAGFCSGLILSSMFGIMPDLSEYTAYYYGVHAAGFLSSFINFAMKFGSAFATAAAGWVLAGIGYQPNVEQTPRTLFAINFMVHIFVALVTVVSGVAMLAYKLDKKTHQDLSDKLARNEHAPGVVLDEEIS